MFGFPGQGSRRARREASLSSCDSGARQRPSGISRSMSIRQRGTVGWIEPLRGRFLCGMQPQVQLAILGSLGGVLIDPRSISARLVFICVLNPLADVTYRRPTLLNPFVLVAHRCFSGARPAQEPQPCGSAVPRFRSEIANWKLRMQKCRVAAITRTVVAGRLSKFSSSPRCHAVRVQRCLPRPPEHRQAGRSEEWASVPSLIPEWETLPACCMRFFQARSLTVAEGIDGRACGVSSKWSGMHFPEVQTNHMTRLPYIG